MPAERFPLTISVPHDAAGQRLDQFLAGHIPDISRARVQQMLAEEKALVNEVAAKSSLKLRGGEQMTILGDFQPRPLRAIAEDIPLDIVYEDDDLAVVNKPAGMMVHAGAGATDDDRNCGTWSTRCYTASLRFPRSAASCGPASCIDWTRKPAA